VSSCRPATDGCTGGLLGVKRECASETQARSLLQQPSIGLGPRRTSAWRHKRIARRDSLLRRSHLAPDVNSLAQNNKRPACCPCKSRKALAAACDLRVVLRCQVSPILFGTTLQGQRMCMTSGDSASDQRVARAYIRLLLAPEGKDGSKTVSLARFGQYEVRLVELSQIDSADAALFWMELYAHHVQLAVDSCGCHELEEAVIAAEELVSQARRLNGSGAQD
jgi:hypothetical protein